MEELVFAFVGELNLAKINKKDGVRYIFLEESQIDGFCNEFRNKKELALLNNSDSYECGVIIHIEKLSQNQDYSVKVNYAESDCDEYIQTEISILQGLWKI